MTKDYSQMSLSELQHERNKLRDRDGDEPVRARFLKKTLDALILLRTPKTNEWVVRDNGKTFHSIEDWKNGA